MHHDKDVFERLAAAKQIPRGKGLIYNPMASLADGTTFALGYIGQISCSVCGEPHSALTDCPVVDRDGVVVE